MFVLWWIYLILTTKGEFLLNRCDFSSISTCLKNHISESNQMSQPDFLYELFEDFMDDPANQDFSMDNGLICRWMTGQAKISPKISAYYSKPSNQEKLAHTIHQNLLPLKSDCNMAIQDIYTLFILHSSCSEERDGWKGKWSVPDCAGSEVCRGAASSCQNGLCSREWSVHFYRFI